jgi:hypothetical protein
MIAAWLDSGISFFFFSFYSCAGILAAMIAAWRDSRISFFFFLFIPVQAFWQQ